jgi:hypothetical protein
VIARLPALPDVDLSGLLHAFTKLRGLLDDPAALAGQAVQILRELALVVIDAAFELLRVAWDLLALLLEGLVLLVRSLLEFRLSIPEVGPFIEKTILGGRKLTLLRIITLLGGIPTTLIYKLVTGRSGPPPLLDAVPAQGGATAGPLAFSTGDDALLGLGLTCRALGLGVLVFTAISDVTETLGSESEASRWIGRQGRTKTIADIFLAATDGVLALIEGTADDASSGSKMFLGFEAGLGFLTNGFDVLALIANTQKNEGLEEKMAGCACVASVASMVVGTAHFAWDMDSATSTEKRILRLEYADAWMGFTQSFVGRIKVPAEQNPKKAAVQGALYAAQLAVSYSAWCFTVEQELG